MMPREAEDALSLKTLKAKLDGVLGSPVWWVTTVPTAERVELNRL